MSGPIVFNPWNSFVGSFIPNCLLSFTDLSSLAKLCWARLAQYAGRDGHCCPSHSRLAKDLGKSEATIRRVLVELVDQGFLMREAPNARNQQRTTHYYFLLHPCFSEAPPLKTERAPRAKVSGSPRSVLSDKETQRKRKAKTQKTGGPANRTGARRGPVRAGQVSEEILSYVDWLTKRAERTGKVKNCAAYRATLVRKAETGELDLSSLGAFKKEQAQDTTLEQRRDREFKTLEYFEARCCEIGKTAAAKEVLQNKAQYYGELPTVEARELLQWDNVAAFKEALHELRPPKS